MDLARCKDGIEFDNANVVNYPCSVPSCGMTEINLHYTFKIVWSLKDVINHAKCCLSLNFPSGRANVLTAKRACLGCLE